MDAPPPQRIPNTPDLPAQSTPNPSAAASVPPVINAQLPATPTVSGPAVPSSSAVPVLASTPAIGPQQLADSFTQGLDVGAPMSQGTSALTQNVMDTAFRPSTSTPDFSGPSVPPAADFSPSTTPTSGSAVAAVDSVQHSTSTGYSPVAASSSPTIYAAPMATVASVAPAAPVISAGPLPAYGADLRPVVAPAVPAVPPSAAAAATAAAPASAPVSPSAGANAFNQQAVVRHQPVPAAPTSVPMGLPETAAAATATGAITGALSAQTAKKTRLQSLIEAVARQEPKLRWAIGERDDSNTVLVTDLACGWIPPHVEIPTGVELLAPERRRSDFESMLADTSLIETWRPGQYLPGDSDVEPTPMSLRARAVPDVDDINWELTQATKWRDGLPRLAHTLAKAGVAGTGILDSETELLHAHLTAAADAVLNAYPDIDPHNVGNWQLLAAIDALISGRRTTLNYHFAWFEALHLTPNRRPR